MKQYYRTIAETEFGNEPNIKIREEFAEQFLIRQYLGEQRGYFVEVGANEPCSLSQTWHLAQLGWVGMLIEPIPVLCDELRKQRPESVVLEAACCAPDAPATASFAVAQDSGKSTLSTEFLDKRSNVMSHITVNLRTLNSLLEEQAVSKLDFISIDVEGTQLDVLQGFDLQRWNPRLLLIEDHLLDNKSHKCITGQGYRLVKRTLSNNWYIPADAHSPLTGTGEDKILRGKFQRIPIRYLRFRLRRLFGRGL